MPKAPYSFRTVIPNVVLYSGRYYFSTDAGRTRLYVKTDADAIEAAKPLLEALKRERVERGLNRLRKRQTKQLVELEAKLRKQFGVV